MIAEGTPPERFAIEHAHYVEDIPFWVALAAETGGPVLDVGAAVGRVTLPLARHGIDVVALDGSSGMLDELAATLSGEPPSVSSLVSLVQSDFRTIDLAGRRFPLAIMPMNSLQALLTRDDQLSCLRAIRRHVHADGVFAFDVVVPDIDGIDGALGHHQPGPMWRDPATGAVLTHAAWYEAVDRATGTVSFTARIDERTPDGTTHAHVRPHTVHLFSPSELWELLHEAGFVVQAVFGDFAGTPLDETSERQVYRCGVTA